MLENSCVAMMREVDFQASEIRFSDKLTSVQRRPRISETMSRAREWVNDPGENGLSLTRRFDDQGCWMSLWTRILWNDDEANQYVSRSPRLAIISNDGFVVSAVVSMRRRAREAWEGRGWQRVWDRWKRMRTRHNNDP